MRSVLKSTGVKLACAALLGVALIGGAKPAAADWHHGGGGWHGGGYHGGWHRGNSFSVVLGDGGYYAPRPYYYRPAYYAPPPAVYYPPPAYYAPAPAYYGGGYGGGSSIAFRTRW